MSIYSGSELLSCFSPSSMTQNDFSSTKSAEQLVAGVDKQKMEALIGAVHYVMSDSSFILLHQFKSHG